MCILIIIPKFSWLDQKKPRKIKKAPSGASEFSQRCSGDKSSADKTKKVFSRKQSKLCTRLSAVIKRPETSYFQAFGRCETLGSNLRYGIPKEFATVRHHSRKVTKQTLSSTSST